MTVIYHLAPADRWTTWPGDTPYVPAEFDTDGFVHCTAGDELMLQVANTVYRDVPGDFVLLVIDVALLASEVRWERPAGPELAPLFPHIYGPIPAAAVVAVRVAQRNGDGTFSAFA